MFSLEEQIILNNIDRKWKYIARDKNGELYLYDTRPNGKGNVSWLEEKEYVGLSMFRHLFQELKWEDAEPTKIKRSPLIKIEEVAPDIERVSDVKVKYNASNHAKQVIDNQIKKGLARYGMGIEDCDLSIKELLDNALEENADAMIYLAELRARLFGHEN